MTSSLKARRLKRVPGTGDARRPDVPIKLDYKLIEEHIQQLARLRDQVSFHITTALKYSTTEHFQTTSLEMDTLQADIEAVLRLLENGGVGIKQSDFDPDGAAWRCFDISTQTRLDALHNIDREPPTVALRTTKFRRSTILNLINFRQMSDRIDDVEIAYKTTLEWIFRDAEYEQNWSSFPNFLKLDHCTHPYWINGKAGSGKSTLLRFLVKHEKTRHHLNNWSGPRRLETAHFFSWNLGTKLQKTQQGLLQSLIHQVLQRDHTLIHQVFPDLWHQLNLTQSKRPDPLTLADTRRAFTRLISLQSAQRRYCFFVDGIDEFAEDHDHIADLLISFCSSDVKFVLSSRPVDACVEKFANCPQLRLQDLTEHDIETYIDGRLASNHAMLDLMLEEPVEARQLVQALKERASGVFLWVKLVIMSLLNGLNRGDDIADLQTRLHALPPDLSKLFESMLSKMNPRYQAQAATLFRLVRTATAVLNGESLPTQFLAVAYRDFRSVQNGKAVSFDTKKIVAWCANLNRQLRSRCCGLLELYVSTYRPDWWDADLDQLQKEDQLNLSSHVQYLHRTVAEYLYQKDVWEKVISRTSENAEFEPNENLAFAALHMMKVSPLADDLAKLPAYTWAQSLVRFVREVERNDGPALVNLVDEMDLVLCHQVPTTNYWASEIELESDHHVAISHLTVLQRPITSLLSFTAFAGLYACLEEKLEKRGLLYAKESSQCLLLQALFSRSDEWLDVRLSDRVETACVLLEHGANPNETFEGPSFWQCILQQLMVMGCNVNDSGLRGLSSRRRHGQRNVSTGRRQSHDHDSGHCRCETQRLQLWIQLIVACLSAGAKHDDIDILVSCTSRTVCRDQCAYVRARHILYQSRLESTQRHFVVEESSILPHPENEHKFLLDQLSKEVKTIFQEPNITKKRSSTSAVPDSQMTEEERAVVNKWYWCATPGKDGQIIPQYFPDRECGNYQCSTKTTYEWRYVLPMQKILCATCYEWWQKTGELRTGPKGKEPLLTEEDLFDESYISVQSLDMDQASEGSEDETETVITTTRRSPPQFTIDDASTPEPGRRPASAQQPWSPTSQSSSLMMKSSSLRVQKPLFGLEVITSGTPHHLRSMPVSRLDEKLLEH